MEKVDLMDFQVIFQKETNRLGSGALFNTSKEINTDFDLVIGKRPIDESCKTKMKKNIISKNINLIHGFNLKDIELKLMQKIKHGISTIDYGLNMLASLQLYLEQN